MNCECGYKFESKPKSELIGKVYNLSEMSKDI